MVEYDITQTALIVRAGNAAAEHALQLQKNEERLIYSNDDIVRGQSIEAHPASRDCTPAVLGEYETHLRYDDEFEDPSMFWTFGYDRCDVFMSTAEEVCLKNQKMSHIHFRIYPDFQTGFLMLQNKSRRYGTTLRAPSLGRHGKIILTNGATHALNRSEITTVVVDDIEFQLEIPDLTRQEMPLYELNWRQFALKFQYAYPGLDGLGLSSPATATPQAKRSGTDGVYKLLEEIGRGEHGIVWKVLEIETRIVYAAKEYFKTGTEQNARNFEEMANLQRISHRHIAKFVDLVADRQGIAMIMEFVDGGTLHDYRKRLSLDEIKTIARQLLEAVAYLHMNNIVHRDIKPTNVLLKSEDFPFAVLTDLGVAKKSGKDAFLSTECGTRKFAAPEIYEGSYTGMIDIFSTGTSIWDSYEGLSDEIDWYSPLVWAREVHRRVTEGSRRIGDPFLRLLQQMVSPDPKARPSAKECLADPCLQVERSIHPSRQNRATSIASNNGADSSNYSQYPNFELHLEGLKQSSPNYSLASTVGMGDSFENDHWRASSGLVHVDTSGKRKSSTLFLQAGSVNRNKRQYQKNHSQENSFSDGEPSCRGYESSLLRRNGQSRPSSNYSLPPTRASRNSTPLVQQRGAPRTLLSHNDCLPVTAQVPEDEDDYNPQHPTEPPPPTWETSVEKPSNSSAPSLNLSKPGRRGHERENEKQFSPDSSLYASLTVPWHHTWGEFSSFYSASSGIEEVEDENDKEGDEEDANVVDQSVLINNYTDARNHHRATPRRNSFAEILEQAADVRYRTGWGDENEEDEADEDENVLPGRPNRTAKCDSGGDDIEEFQRNEAETHANLQLIPYKPSSKSYNCQLCSKQFNQRRWLERHLRSSVHTLEKPFECNICGRKYNRRDNLAQHYRNVHKLRDQDGATARGSCFNCRKREIQCLLVSPSRDPKASLSQEQIQPLESQEVLPGYVTFVVPGASNPSSLVLRTKDANLCITGILQMAGFDTSLKRCTYLNCHKVPHTLKSYSGSIGPQSWADVRIALAVCWSVLPRWAPALENTLQSLGYLSNGQAMHPEVHIPSPSDEEDTSALINNDTDVQKAANSTLADPEKPDNRRDSLLRHIRAKHPNTNTNTNTMVRCEICHKDFSRPSNLTRHKKTAHNTHRPFSCLICEKTFKRSDNLAQHMLAVHPR